MSDIVRIILASLPETIGALTAAAIIAAIGLVVRRWLRKKPGRDPGPSGEGQDDGPPPPPPFGFGKMALDEAVDKVRTLVASSKYSQAVRVAAEMRREIASTGESQLDPSKQLSLGELNVWYAHALMYTGDTDEALSLLRNEVIGRLGHSSSIYESDQFGSSRWNLVIGRAHNHIGYAQWMDKGHYEAALTEFYQAINHFKRAQLEEELATVCDNLGRVYSQIGFRTRGQILLRHGMLLRQKLANESRDFYRYALSLNSSAIAHLMTGNSHLALLEVEEARKIFEQQVEQKGERGYGLALITKGRALRYMGANWRHHIGWKESRARVQEAIHTLQLAERIFFEKVDEDIRLLEVRCELGRAYRELAALSLLREDRDTTHSAIARAEDYLTQVIKYSDIDTRYPVLFVDACHDLGQTFLVVRDYAKAKKYLQQSFHAIPPRYHIKESLGFESIPVHECVEEYWQVLAKTCRLFGEILLAQKPIPTNFSEGTLPKDTSDALTWFTQAAAYYGRFLDRPLEPNNLGMYPRIKPELQLESHRLFVQYLHNLLRSLPDNVLIQIRELVYDKISQQYRMERSWVDSFFAEPFVLLLYSSPDKATENGRVS